MAEKERAGSAKGKADEVKRDGDTLNGMNPKNGEAAPVLFAERRVPLVAEVSATWHFQ